MADKQQRDSLSHPLLNSNSMDKSPVVSSSVTEKRQVPPAFAHMLANRKKWSDKGSAKGAFVPTFVNFATLPAEEKKIKSWESISLSSCNERSKGSFLSLTTRRV